jgi:hypothetical protein
MGMSGRWFTLGIASAFLWGCATWEPVRNLSSMPSGDLGRVRLVTADSIRMSLDDAFLIDASIVGSLWDGQSVKIPVDKISSLEHRHVDGFPIFLAANVASFVLLSEAVKGLNSSPPPPVR